MYIYHVLAGMTKALQQEALLLKEMIAVEKEGWLC
jgi:hypothetical protein